MNNQRDLADLQVVSGQGVSAETKLIEDFANCLKEKYEKDIVAIVFPSIIDLLKGSDTNIEIIKSSEL